MAGALANTFTALKVGTFKLRFGERFIFEFTDRVDPTNKGPVLMAVEPFFGGRLGPIDVGNGKCCHCDGKGN